MDAFGNLAQAIGPVIAGVHRGHVREQSLGGADVAGGFFAADMLFASLKRKAQGRASPGILRDADNPARHIAFESVTRGKECSMRSSVSQRDAEPLCAADGDVRAEFSGRLEEREGEKIGGDGDKSAGLVSFG